jgi:hypothetical protein
VSGFIEEGPGVEEAVSPPVEIIIGFTADGVKVPFALAGRQSTLMEMLPHESLLGSSFRSTWVKHLSFTNTVSTISVRGTVIFLVSSSATENVRPTFISS